DFNIYAPFGDTGNKAVIFPIFGVCHELYLLVLDGSTLGIGGTFLALRRVLTFHLIRCTIDRTSAIEETLKQPMYHHDRIPTYRRGEMRVVFTRKSDMTFFLRAVFGYAH